MKTLKLLLIVMLAGLIPDCLSAQTIVSTATGGNWSDPNTWVGNVVPVSTDDVVIADGATVVIDVNADAQQLTVGQGNSGLLVFQDAGAVTLTVGGDLLIDAGGTFQSAANGTETGHLISIAGSLHNNGILDLSTNGNTAGAALLFTGSSNTVLDGTGAVTDVLLLTVDKGTDASSLLEIKPDVLTFKGSNTAPGTDAGFLTILNGTCKLGGSFALNNGLFTGTTNYTIPSTGGFWMANPNVVVAGRDGTAYCDGTLIMDAGVLNVGVVTENRLGYIAGSVVTINGGEINVACRFTATTTFGLTYTQTGGVITVNTVENSRQTYASFDIRPIDNSSFTMTGGKIVLQHPNLSLVGPRDYSVIAVNTNITGGTLQVGNAATTGTHTFFVRGTAPDIEINNAAGPATVQLNGNLQVKNTNIQSGCTLKLDNGTNGYQYTQTGASLVNDGSIDGNFSGAELNFSGVLGVAQTYSGTGSFSTVLESLQLDNTQTIDFANTTAQDITIRQ
ncbi:MAG TPA: G8 domain-containing protein, partial [Ferruginibacter sp.]|nr:G8 domain-containing protein [Ferruginibacter sp.]